MKKIMLVGVCMAALCGTVRAQGIVVNDPASIIEQIEQLGQQAKSYALQAQQWVTEQLSWTKQIAQYALQAQQYAVATEELIAFVHSPNLGTAMSLLNQAGLGSTMPVSPYAVLGLVNGFNSIGAGGVPNIGGIASSLSSLSGSSYVANHVYTPTDGSWNSQQLIATGNSINATQGTALASYQQIQMHAQAMQALRNCLTSATNPKDVADIMGEIELENLWTGNQQASLSALQIAAQTQDAARTQRDNESMDKGIDDFLAQATAAGRGI